MKPTPPPRPPPLPARAPTPPAASGTAPVLVQGVRAPLPSDDGVMSTRAKMSLADVALQLRDEQLKARVVHYKADLETNQELDAVTAQVVAELQALQRAAGRESAPPPQADRAQLEIELIQSFKVMLGRLFRADKLPSLLERKMGQISKRFARLFFASELHEKMRGSESAVRTMRFPEQAIFHVFARHEAELQRGLESFEYESPEVAEQAKERLSDLLKELRNAFLGKTTPELNQLVKILNEVLVQFFTQELPPATGELAWEVVKEARLADAKVRAGYKISQEAFPRFRQAFERRFLQRFVGFAEDEMLARVRNFEGNAFRVDTQRFVADPQIFTDVCELVCDAVYDFLYSDGFLDLPTDWRARLSQG
jgi:hypothetical protein